MLTALGHDSAVSIVYPSGPTICTVKIPSLPLVTLTWTSENSIVAAGHDCQPLVFSGLEGDWQAVGSLDDVSGSKSDNTRTAGSPVGRLKTGAFATFRDADTRGHAGSGTTSSDTKLLTVHQNTITSVRPYAGNGAQITKVSTTGVDGTLVIWDANEVVTGGVGILTGRMGGINLR
jgi:actin related protein 2/3 complex subunit 1A/1B